MKRILAPALLCAPLLAFAQTTPAPSAATATKLTEEQTASILKQLDQIEATITKNRGDSFTTALARFKAASAADKEAIDLYAACTKLENFDRRDRKATEFQEWKDQNENRFKDPDFPIALRLQLEYLVLSIQAQDVKDTKDMGPLVTSLQAFVPKAIGAIQASMKHSASGAVEEKNRGGGGGGPRGGGGGGRGGPGGPPSASQILNTLRGSVKGTIFSQAYQIDQMLTKQNWEYSPMNINGIYRNAILPYYLEAKPAEVPAQYDAMITNELAVRKATMSESEFLVYYKEAGPDLQWDKATFLLQHQVTPILAMADMLKIIRENPTHPKAPNWLKQLRQAVNGGEMSEPPVSGDPGAPPPPAPPAQ